MTKRLKPVTQITLPHGNASQVAGCSGIRTLELQARMVTILMSKIKDVERSIEVIAGQLTAQQMLMETIIVEAMRMKAIGEAQIMVLLTQGMDAFELNENMTKHETFGAIGTLTSVADTIKRAKDAKLID
ncbi:MAG: hypothetical protein ACEPO2_22400 [Pelagibaca sp.]